MPKKKIKKIMWIIEDWYMRESYAEILKKEGYEINLYPINKFKINDIKKIAGWNKKELSLVIIDSAVENELSVAKNISKIYDGKVLIYSEESEPFDNVINLLKSWLG